MSVVCAHRAAAVDPPEPVGDPEIVGAYLEDASGLPAGRARGLVRPRTEAEAAAFLRQAARMDWPVLFQAARSSLTGGAVPRDEIVLSVERMTGRGAIERGAGSACVRVGPGLRLAELQRGLAADHLYYPPVPTYQLAMVGGTVATNAGGAASFKYGVTRDWVRGLRVVLANGDVLELARGEALARPGEAFRIRLSDGTELRVPAPGHRLPALKKISAGYWSADPLDLVDLFIGSEGTLGLVSEVTLALAPAPAAVLTGLAFVERSGRGLELGAELRAAALAARAAGDERGPDVRAIEWLDRACLDLLRSGGAARSRRVELPRAAGAALLFELELPRPLTAADAGSVLEALLDGRGEAADGPLQRLFRILERHGALEGLQLAFPDDRARGRALGELREAAPTLVAERLAEVRRAHPGVSKVGGDPIVPFERLPEALAIYERVFARRGLEHAVWGHLSDGNLHPNGLPRDERETRLGFEALLELGDAVTGLGGCPLSEHGVGRHPVKQEMLRRFLGPAGLDGLRAVKRVLDPRARLGRGVLFPHA